jgi:nucleoside-diphosphate-sugar epimerase
VNLGAGREISIRELVQTIARLCDFRGAICWDASQPDGQPRRMLDTSRAKRLFAFEATTDFEQGLRLTIEWYLAQISGERPAPPRHAPVRRERHHRDPAEAESGQIKPAA